MSVPFLALSFESLKTAIARSQDIRLLPASLGKAIDRVLLRALPGQKTCA